MTTFVVGQIVTVNPKMKTGRLTGSFKVLETIDVPENLIEYNPNLHPDDNETGVGHHQWLILEGHPNMVSGKFFEKEI